MIDHRLDGEIHNGRHHLPVRIYYEDTDCAGIVYHASFIRFMERGRTNYLRLLGVTEPEEVKGASITLRQTVMRGEEVLVDGHVQVAFVSGGRARPIPKPLRIAMRAYQDSTSLQPAS